MRVKTGTEKEAIELEQKRTGRGQEFENTRFRALLEQLTEIHAK